MANLGKTGIWPNVQWQLKSHFLTASKLQRGKINFFHHSEANTWIFITLLTHSETPYHR